MKAFRRGFEMAGAAVVLAELLSGASLLAAEDKPAEKLSVDYDAARAHEIKPHRRYVPVEGAMPGFSQLRLQLTVSPIGDVVDAKASGGEDVMKYWPEVQGEVRGWRFEPFEKNGKAVTAEIEEYLDLVPPERMPKVHVTPPVVRPTSKVTITLQRSVCYGTCPAYTVAVSTEGLVFDGRFYVVASGKHSDRVDADEVRSLAKRFVAADFYSMANEYSASVTDNHSKVLCISIDGKTKQVFDYVGEWVGMPAVIADLEEEVDSFARTQRWVEGSEGLVAALRAEGFDFRTYDAQMMMKAAANRGETATVGELLAAGVPLRELPSPVRKKDWNDAPFQNEGWLTVASGHPETLLALIEAGASKHDVRDKDLALAGAARSGSLPGVRALIAYGADPNADLRNLSVPEIGDGMTVSQNGAGSVLIYAAQSGNPEVVREVLRYHPKLEARGEEGKTAMFAAGDYRSSDGDGARVECVRLLAKAGADVNARDEDGNTPLHETFLTDVEEELLKLGANVNARNKDGETPIFTTVDNDAIPLFIEHGADLTIRNNKGETVMEAARGKGPLRQEALRAALAGVRSR